jgi:hypothetical protein
MTQHATGSGSATSGGITFQHRVAAYYAALILAGEARVPGLGSGAEASQVWLETDEPIDDVKVVDVLGDELLIQAKRTLSASSRATSEFAKVCDQLVRGQHQCADSTQFFIAVGRDTGGPIAKELSTILKRAREQPASAAPRHLAPTAAERSRYDLFITQLRRTAKARALPADAETLRAILRRTEIRVLDVEPNGTEEHFAVRALERDVVLDPTQARAAWSALIEICGELARARSHTGRLGLQTALRVRGIALREPPDLRPEIAALRTRSADSLRLLQSRSAIRLSDRREVKIHRRASSELARRAGEGSVAVVGDAGSGKTGCTHEALELLRADGVEVIVIAAELLEAHTDTALAHELRISRPLHELLTAWPIERGVLVIDGLDAARDESTRATLVRLIEQVTNANSTFTVLASLRTFDLRNSVRLERILPARTAETEEFKRAEFKTTEHFWVPALAENEVAQLAIQAPELDAVLQAATPAVREIAALPFNLSLLAELVLGDRLDANNLEAIDTPLALLEAYWRERVRDGDGGDDREHLLRRTCEAMVAARRLYADRRELQGPSNDALRSLLHDHVLVEDTAQGRETVAFAHNQLHDYAVARTVVRVEDDQLVGRLKADTGLLLSARPSLELHFRWLWEAEETRAMFWSAALKIGGEPGLRPIGKTIAPAVAVDSVRVERDLKALLDALNDGDPSRVAAAEEVLRQLSAAVMTVPASEIIGRGPVWPRATLRAAETARPATAHTVKILIHRQLESTSEPCQELGEASRRLLRFAWDQPNHDSVLVRASMLAVLQTFATDMAASEAILREAIEQEHLASYGYDELPTLLTNPTRLVHTAPGFLADCYEAVFGHEETSDAKTQVTASRIMALTSNRRQDYDHARWQLGEAFKDFLENAPTEATRALVPMVAARVGRYSVAITSEPFGFRWRSRLYKVYGDSSSIWDSGHVYETAEKALADFDEHLEACARSDAANLAPILDALATQPIPAAVLAHVFRAASRAPNAFPEQLAELLTKPAVLSQIDLQFAAGQYLQAVFPLLPAKTRQRIEAALRELPRRWPDDRREIGERARDRLVGTLDTKAIITPSMQRSRTKLAKEGPPELQPPFRFDIHTEYQMPAREEDIAAQSADATRDATRMPLQAIESLKAFADTHLNEIPTRDAIRSIAPLLRQTVRRLADGTYGEADPVALDEARLQVSQVGERLSRAPAILTAAQGRLVSEVLATASNGPSASALNRWGEVTSWSPSPRNSAAEGLPQLTREQRFTTPEVLSAITRLAGDHTPEARFQIAWRLGALVSTAPELAWELAERLASKERSGSVLERLAHCLNALVQNDSDRGLALAESVLQRERRRKEPRDAVVGAYASFLITHHVWRGTEPGERAAKQLAIEGAKRLESVRALLHALRDALYHGPAPGDDTAHAEIRRRSLEVLGVLLDAATSGIESLRDRHGGSFGGDWSDDDAQELRGWLRLAAGIVDQLYFASGVFQAGQSSSDERHADEAQRERLYREAHELLEALTRLGEPHATHHLIAMLEGCIRFDPIGVFQLVGQAVRSSSAWGYQFEPMGEELIIRIVKRYVTDHREIFRDSHELEATLADLLDVFVEAGWPGAQRLVYGLAEIFR